MTVIQSSFAGAAIAYLQRLQGCFSSEIVEAIETLATELLQAWAEGRNVYICGNGGSAANAMHLANDFHYGIGACGHAPRCRQPRASRRAMCRPGPQVALGRSFRKFFGKFAVSAKTRCRKFPWKFAAPADCFQPFHGNFTKRNLMVGWRTDFARSWSFGTSGDRAGS